jgi:hypothetical protein
MIRVFQAIQLHCASGSIFHGGFKEMKTEQNNQVKFSTGAIRSNDAESARYDLITPIGLRRLAERYALGSKKYGDFNWEKGMPINDLLNHALSHINQFLSGDRSDDHLAGAAWGLMASMHSQEQWPELNTNLRQPNNRLPLSIKAQQPISPPGDFESANL